MDVDAPSRGATRGPRSNSLNLVRLVLAGSVLVSHARLTDGLSEPVIRGDSVGAWAVACFFVVSGYLITDSRYRLPLGTYLLHRLARIMPAYWICLVVTALLAVVGFAGTVPVGELLGGGVRYVGANALLVQVQGDIAGTPTGVPYPGEWNASLWTLAHEMACYLILAALALVIPRRRAAPAYVVVWAVSVLGLIALPHVLADPPLFITQFARLAPYFAAGAAMRWLVPMDRFRAIWVLPAAAGFVVLVLVDARFGGQLGAPLLCYVLLGIATHVPSPALIHQHDISYGVYIYAFPFSQLLATPDVDLAFPLYLAFVALLTVGAATLSWLLVERRVLRWARARGRAGAHVARSQFA
jgi:peptidoglycan/LPS O-acetylase OafA/YrhL